MFTQEDIDKKSEELKVVSRQLKSAKKKVIIQAFVFMLLFLTIGFLIGFTLGLNVNNSDVVLSSDCVDSLECEKNCNSFYPGDEDHILECRYKCLTFLNCNGTSA